MDLWGGLKGMGDAGSGAETNVELKNKINKKILHTIMMCFIPKEDKKLFNS